MGKSFLDHKKKPIIAVIGAGPAGVFAAIRAAKNNQNEVIVLESTSQILAKVKVSGGGRCNVTHSYHNPREFVKNYPRGFRELKGPLSYFSPLDTVEWFQSYGVQLKTECDGRVFPITNRSQDIIDVLLEQASREGVKILSSSKVQDIKPQGNGFSLVFSEGKSLYAEKVLLATGGSKEGMELAKKLGHTIISPVPSLFSLNLEESYLSSLAGVSVDPVEIQIPACKIRQRGPLLVTHTGISGPATLKLSAKAARFFAEENYQLDCVIDWLIGQTEEELRSMMVGAQKRRSNQLVEKKALFGLPIRLWKELVNDDRMTWNQLSRSKREDLIQKIKRSSFKVTAKATHKSEFVTCGGVKLSEVDFKTMESKISPNLFFAGEVLDIDGFTGGFNFQAAWTTGMVAGNHLG